MRNPHPVNQFERLHILGKSEADDNRHLCLGRPLVVAQLRQPAIAPVLGALRLPENRAAQQAGRTDHPLEHVPTGGVMSCRIASNSVRIPSSCPAILRSRSARLVTRSFCSDIVSRSRTNARMIAILTAIARSLLRTLESMATPCSVNALTLRACLMLEPVTICDRSRISAQEHPLSTHENDRPHKALSGNTLQLALLHSRSPDYFTRR